MVHISISVITVNPTEIFCFQNYTVEADRSQYFLSHLKGTIITAIFAFLPFTYYKNCTCQKYLGFA